MQSKNEAGFIGHAVDFIAHFNVLIYCKIIVSKAIVQYKRGAAQKCKTKGKAGVKKNRKNPLFSVFLLLLYF